MDINPADQIKLVKLAHMRCQLPDLDKITTFLEDFGMHVARRTTKSGTKAVVPTRTYYARKGERRYLGGTSLVESMEHLVRVSHQPCASKIVRMSDAPGGGSILSLTDPEGLFGELDARTAANGSRDSAAESDLQRRHGKARACRAKVRQFNRFIPGPAAVHKLGHLGLCVQSFDKQLRWFTETFSLAPTDVLYVDRGKWEEARGDFHAH
ncbi:hypothetical protein LTR17_014477 [Elasticomyces elasticus]|nr:hypothetical protein LTR17_014477 [Elasticomyces elasticus]